MTRTSIPGASTGREVKSRAAANLARFMDSRMEKTPPIGMIKRGSTVQVWIETDDNRRLPVRFQVGFRFGNAFVVPNRRAIRSGGRKLA